MGIKSVIPVHFKEKWRKAINFLAQYSECHIVIVQINNVNDPFIYSKNNPLEGKITPEIFNNFECEKNILINNHLNKDNVLKKEGFIHLIQFCLKWPNDLLFGHLIFFE